MAELKPGEPLEEFLASPLKPGEIRVLHCAVCGAVTHIRSAAWSGVSVGDPEAHNRWHDRKGLLAKVRRALTWR
jgi:hypothetical protein